MIRKSIYIACTSLALGCGACNDWLTIVPETTLVADNLFETETGVLQVLYGAYVLTSQDIYAPSGNVGGGDFAEHLACTWTSSNTEMKSLLDHVYVVEETRIGERLDDVFMKIFKIINTLNPMIEGCDKNRDKFSTVCYNMVKGEALALRASLHLDLMRYWGPMPTRIDGSMEYLPYVRNNSVSDYTYYTFNEYMELLLADLDEAEQLLRQSDPILEYPADGSTAYSGEWTNRKAHFNYYGVLALQARARLWMNDKEGAVRYAKMVIDAKNEDGSSKFTLATEDNYGDLSFYTEHICGMNQNNFNFRRSGFTDADRQLLYGQASSTFVQDLFNGNRTDLRFKLQWTQRRTAAVRWYYATKKYDGMDMTGNTAQNFPVVRLAEMYLIIMEAGTLAEANAAYQTYITTRNLDYVAMTNENRAETVLMEYLREFIAEGQNFFTYKRFAVKRMLWQSEEALDCEEEQYVLPLPPSEYKER